MRATTAATAALCLLGTAFFLSSAVLAADVAEPASKPQQKGFLQFASPSSYYDRADVKHLCMLEGPFEEGAVGCDDIEVCDDSSGCQSEGCYPEQTLRSELTCCPEKGYEAEESVMGMGPPKIGQCEWHFAFYQCPEFYQGDGGECGNGNFNFTGYADSYSGFILTHNGALQIGTAWATCYLNSDSETCGHPFCGQMVLSFQGTFHAVEAYVEEDAATYRATESKQARKSQSQSRQRLRRAVEHSPLGKKIAAKHPNAFKPAQHARELPSNTEGTVYTPALAYIVTGPVQVTATGRSFEWTHGMMEYVFDFDVLGTSLLHPPADAYVYSPYTYNLALSSSNGPYETYEDKAYKPEPDYYNKERDYKYYEHSQ